MARAPKPTPVAEPETVITNNMPGTTLHLGDGRKIAYGESAMLEGAPFEADQLATLVAEGRVQLQ